MSATHGLTAAQALASDPSVSAWVSASAGSGKTSLLTARVLRLLLANVPPQAILCLTFTKTAAAEMVNRVYEALAHWTRLDDVALEGVLTGLNAPSDEAGRMRARALFAQALDAVGGLRIQTIHAFAQSLLAAFPLEAGVPPGFEVEDDRSGRQRLHAALCALMERALADGSSGLLADARQGALAVGELELVRLLGRLAQKGSIIRDFAGPGGRLALAPKIRVLLDLPQAGGEAEWVAQQRTAGRLDPALVMRVARRPATTKKLLQKVQDQCAAWGRLDPVQQQAQWADLMNGLVTDGERINGNILKLAVYKDDPALAADLTTLVDDLCALEEGRRLFALADTATPLLRLAYDLSLDLEERRVLDASLAFDDLIRLAVRLLEGEGAAAWVRFKLDERIDHVLVDEAQDTSDPYWRILKALSDDFFTGQAAKDSVRTVFAVGDVKQAIYGFQGSDPQTFQAAEQFYARQIAAGQAQFRQVPLASNFRSAASILTVVDRVIADIGFAEFGETHAIPLHEAQRSVPGCVVVWPLLAASSTSETVPEDSEDDGLEEQDWQPAVEVVAARAVADRIADWLRTRRTRPDGQIVKPGDILLLVRKRSEYAAALARALAERGIPTAGIDRIALRNALAVQDLLALLRFLAQPLEDLALAQLLKSPFINWMDPAEETLIALAAERPREESLWAALARMAHAQGGIYRTAYDWLLARLALVDRAPPFELLNDALVQGGGMTALLTRFGAPVREPVEELLQLTLTYEAKYGPNLQGFLHWMAGSDAEVKRDAASAGDAVRIMTVHGAKGLQAPIVILADANRTDKDQEILVSVPILGQLLPLPVVGGKAEAPQWLKPSRESESHRLDQERNRLLYVALTRAEQELHISGWVPRKVSQKAGPSWWMRVSEALTVLGASEQAEGALVYGAPFGEASASGAMRPPAPIAGSVVIPGWLHRAQCPPEPRPPRPLAPSRPDVLLEGLGEGPAVRTQAAARRGTLIHRLLEQLPLLLRDQRAQAGEAFLTRAAPELSETARTALLAAVMGCFTDPALAALFSSDALAEVPIIAVVGESVISGRIDRLLVRPESVLAVDVKTSAQPPAVGAPVPEAYRQQMAAYGRALAAIYPDRPIQLGLLWTAVPRLDLLTLD